MDPPLCPSNNKNIPYIGCIKSLVLMKEMEEENGKGGMNASLGLRESLFYLQELTISNVVDWLIIIAMILLRSQLRL